VDYAKEATRKELKVLACSLSQGFASSTEATGKELKVELHEVLAGLPPRVRGPHEATGKELKDHPVAFPVALDELPVLEATGKELKASTAFVKLSTMSMRSNWERIKSSAMSCAMLTAFHSGSNWERIERCLGDGHFHPY
jgi:hypothetical protein